MHSASQVAALRLLADDQSAVTPALSGTPVRRRRRPFVGTRARTVLEQGIASGDFRSVDLETVPSMLIGMFAAT